MPNLKRNLPIIYALLATLSFIFLSTYLVNNYITSDYLKSDLGVFYKSGQVVLTNQVDKIYDTAFQRSFFPLIFVRSTDSFLGYISPPVVAFMFAPVAHLPYYVVFLGFALLLTVIYILYAYWTHKIFTIPYALSALCLALFSPFVISIVKGQLSFLVLLAILLIFTVHKFPTNKYVKYMLIIAGGLLTIKFQYLLLLPFVKLPKGLTKFLWLGVILMGLLNFVLVGPQGSFDYLYFLATCDYTQLGTIINTNLNLLSFSIFQPWIPVFSDFNIGVVSALLYLLCVFLALFREWPNNTSILLFGTFVVLLFNAHTMYSDLIILYPFLCTQIGMALKDIRSLTKILLAGLFFVSWMWTPLILTLYLLGYFCYFVKSELFFTELV